jgi:hypothetical protein
MLLRCLLFSLLTLGLHAQSPSGFGINIHFLDAPETELDLLRDAGFQWVRMDMTWSWTERAPGDYDFSAYDRLLASLDARQMRAVLILDYGHPAYENGQAPTLPATRQAFARWVAAAVQRYQGRGVIWEMWNEPNLADFWKPRASAQDYILLAREVGAAIRATAPSETFIGPAVSGFDLAFLEACFRGGLLEYWDAVSVHPYRGSAPETVAEDFRNLQRLIRRYAPPGREIPVFSGEWGYTDGPGYAGLDAQVQAQYLVRQSLINRAEGVPLSIWYDWRDDGTRADYPEHHYGIVGPAPALTPKPAYAAARQLYRELSGFRFLQRLSLNSPNDYALLFQKDGRQLLAAWTVAEPHAANLPTGAGQFRVRSIEGEEQFLSATSSAGLRMTLTPAVQYIEPESATALLQLAAAWRAPSPELLTDAPANVEQSLCFTNPLSQPVRWRRPGESWTLTQPGGTACATESAILYRNSDVETRRVQWEFESLGSLATEVRFAVGNPLALKVLPASVEGIPVEIANPTADAWQGRLRAVLRQGGRNTEVIEPLQWGEGGTLRSLTIPWLRTQPQYSVALTLENDEGQVQAVLPARTYRLLEPPTAVFDLVPDGDAAVGWWADLQTDTLDTPTGANTVWSLQYRYDAGWKFLRLTPARPAATLPGHPTGLQLWIYGDASGNWICPRVRGADGQTFQPPSVTINWQGWRLVDFNWTKPGAGHWGGNNDGILRYPLTLDTLLLLDSAGRRATQGELRLAAPTLVD